MRFKHTFHVFVDNFSLIYKYLLYSLIVTAFATGLYTAIIYPFSKALTDSPEFIQLTEGVKTFLLSLLNGEVSELGDISRHVKTAFEAIIALISDNRANIIWGIVALFAVYLVHRFFTGLGNYSAAAVVNDKMALRAQSKFFLTLVRNLKEASLYNLIYVPLTSVYDLIIFGGLFYVMFILLDFIHMLPVRLFLYVVCVIIALSLKMTFTCDWLPALIRGKAGQKKAFVFAFSRKNKDTFNVLSNYIVLCIIIFIANVCATIFSFGAAALITIPASFIVLTAFAFVNYYDREELKYFIDKNTIVKPEKERSLSREEFFKGADD